MNPLQLVRSGKQLIGRIAVIAIAAIFAACSGGAPTQQNPITTPPTVQTYSGPPAQTADVAAFQIALWEKIRPTNRCGGCHVAGGQPPQFARADDINQAYEAANTVVNLQQPDQSRMVIKVGGGHNCWLASNSACADVLTAWITDWAGSTASGGRQIQLTPPPIKEVGASKSFPSTSTDFGTKIWTPILRPFCARCHSPNAVTQQAPYFASADVEEAYDAAKNKINLDTPAASRFVVRLKDEFHNCWITTANQPPNCVESSQAMLAAITDYAGNIAATPVDPSLVVSKALKLYEGTVASGGNRYDSNVIALYEFKTGIGNIAYDTSGVEPALNLEVSDLTNAPIEWVGGWGIKFKPKVKAKGLTATSKKLADLIKSTGEYTVEAWVTPGDVAQEDAYIVSYSGGEMARNFTLGQHAYQYEMRARSSKTDANGTPALLTSDVDRDAQASLQHVVLTYDAVKGRRLYVNGVDTGDIDPQGGGNLADWDDTFALVLGNETSSNRQWNGVIRLVAIHNRALTPAQITQNFKVGVGERYFMLFSVSDRINVPQSYLMFEASQLDSYAYQFTKPTFISLEPNVQVPSIELKGLRIGVNGAEAKVGQAYIPLDVTVDGSNYVQGSGQLLSTVGTTIAVEKGPMSDEFFVSFEKIGTQEHLVDVAANDQPVNPGSPASGTPQPDIGMRTFEELNATMSKITGVSTTTASVAQTYNLVKQQLPTVESIDTFLASHQTGIAQLAIEYCSALVEDSGKRTAFFGSLDPNGTGSYIDSNRTTLINALVSKAVGTNIGNQASVADVSAELNALVTKLTSGGAAGQAGRAGVVMKASCGAVLGSGAILLQ